MNRLIRRAVVATLAAGAIALAPGAIVLGGDSNARGAATTADENAFAAAYVPNARIKVWSEATLSWVTWTPNSVTGVDNAANDGHPGPDLGYIRRWVEEFPTRDLYIIKYTRAGSHASRGPISSTFTGSISSNVLTVTSGAVTNLKMLVGPSIQPGTHTMTSGPAGGADPNKYVRTYPGSTYTGGNKASQTINSYDMLQAWDVNEGSRYTGLLSPASKGFKGVLTTALAALPATVVLQGTLWSLGGNDAADTDAANRFVFSATELLAAYRADFPSLAALPIAWTQPRAGTTGTTVSGALVEMARIDATIRVVPTGDLTRHDAVHFTIAGYETIGRRSFDLLAQANGVKPSLTLGQNLTIGAQTYRVIGPTPLAPWNVTSEGDGWYRMEARQGERRVEDGANAVRRVGFDGFEDLSAYGEVLKNVCKKRYSAAALAASWFTDYEAHCKKHPSFPTEYEGSGPAKLVGENGNAFVGLRQYGTFDVNGAMTGVVRDVLWTDTDGSYHRIQPDLEYEWEQHLCLDEVNGFWRVWVTERDPTGTQIITPKTQVINYSGPMGYGSGRVPYHQERVYAADSAGPPIWKLVKPVSYVQEAAPWVNINDTFDTVEQSTGLPADYAFLRKQGGTGTAAVTGGQLNVASGSAPTGVSTRVNRPLKNVAKDGVTQYLVEVDYKSSANGQSNLLLFVFKDLATGSTAGNQISLNGSTGGIGGNSGTAATLSATITVPADAANPHVVLEGPTTLNRGMEVYAVRVTKVV